MFEDRKEAKKIVVSVPVSGKGVAEQIREMVDEMVVLEKPEFYQAVAQVYRNWYDVPDREVIKIRKEWENKH